MATPTEIYNEVVEWHNKQVKHHKQIKHNYQGWTVNQMVSHYEMLLANHERLIKELEKKL